jgi:hypothetical protein
MAFGAKIEVKLFRSEIAHLPHVSFATVDVRSTHHFTEIPQKVESDELDCIRFESRSRSVAT